MPQDKETHRNYMNEQNDRRRTAAIQSLGGACVICGTTNNLDFDHVDPTTKLFTISSGLSRTESVFWAEVAKCQLLCRPHHVEKSSSEISEAQLGNKNANFKLRDLDIKYIRELSRLGHSQRAIGREFGVTHQTIGDILRGRTWSQV